MFFLYNSCFFLFLETKVCKDNDYSNILQIICDILLIIPNPDIMAGYAEGTPGDVHPAVAGQELVGQIVNLQKRYQALELTRVLGTDVSGLTL